MTKFKDKKVKVLWYDMPLIGIIEDYCSNSNLYVFCSEDDIRMSVRESSIIVL
ncbi:hypothetical protein KAR91_00570 [Candidatus Pacearchaeota archaeon]|nr:hypothetical protein [Candidatus Pacearchaeota archaeon]